MFSVRLVKADHYMNAPISGLDVRYSEFRAVEVKQVPVIRIFGSTPSGQKVCVHVHGVFPYIYIPYDGLVAKDRFLYEVASGIDKALNISLGNSNSSNQHVYKITLVSAIPFYGYHSKTHQFLKIFFYNPLMVKKASDLLQNGVILGQIFQPHEAHIPFILQFCIDYNLHGMSFVRFSTVRYRQGRIEGSEIKIASLQGIPEELVLPENILRLSTCNLEVDAVAADIINQKEISGHLSRNPGLQSIWNEEKQRRRKENRCSQFTPQNSQPRCAPLTSSEVFHLDRLKKHLGLTALLKENVEKVLEKSFSGDKPKPYPAPTPAGENLLDASMLHTHISSLNSDKTCNTSLENSMVLKDSNVHIDEREVLSVTSSQNQLESSQSSFLNSQGLSLVNALQELVEDDSVLGSQTLAIDESNKEEVDDDMSQILNVNEQEVSSNCTSPLRISSEEVPSCSTSPKIPFVLPQLDGANDLLGEEGEKEEDDVKKQKQEHEPNPGLSGNYVTDCTPQIVNDISYFPLPESSLNETDYISLTKSEESNNLVRYEETVENVALGEHDSLENFSNEVLCENLDQCSDQNLVFSSIFDSEEPIDPCKSEILPKCILISDPWLSAQPPSSEGDEFLNGGLTSVKDSWSADVENNLWLLPSSSDLTENISINLHEEEEIVGQYPTELIAETTLEKDNLSQVSNVPSSETKRRLSSLIKSRSKAKEIQNANKVNCDLICVDEIGNSEREQNMTDFESPAPFGSILQGSDYDQFLDETCQISVQSMLCNVSSGSLLTDFVCDNDIKIMESPDKYYQNKGEVSGLSCEEVLGKLGGEDCLTSSSGLITSFPKANQRVSDQLAKSEQLLEKRRRGRKPKWLKELEKKSSNSDETVTKLDEEKINYHLRSRLSERVGEESEQMNTRQRGQGHRSKIEGGGVIPGVNIACPNTGIEPQNYNSKVKERLGVLVPHSLDRKDCRKLDNDTCKIGNTLIFNGNTENAVDGSWQIKSTKQLESFENRFSLSLRKKKLNRARLSTETNPLQESTLESCNINLNNSPVAEIPENIFEQSCFPLSEKKVSSGSVESEDLRNRKNMGQYVRQRLGRLVELRSKRLLEKASESNTGVCSFQKSDDIFENDKVLLKKHHKRKRKEAKSVHIPSGQQVACDSRISTANENETVLLEEQYKKCNGSHIFANNNNNESVKTSELSVPQSDPAPFEDIESSSKVYSVSSSQSSDSENKLLKLHSIKPCFVKLYNCDTMSSEEKVLNTHYLFEQQLDCNVESSEQMENEKKENCTESCFPKPSSLLMRNNVQCASEGLSCVELNMKCLVPNSPKSTGKFVKKASEVGSLKAVIQAESPRVADTLDTLPENPAKFVRHYAPSGGMYMDSVEREPLCSSGLGISRSVSAVMEVPVGASSFGVSQSLYNARNSVSSNDRMFEAEDVLGNTENVNYIIGDVNVGGENVCTDFLSFTRGSCRRRSLCSNDDNVLRKGKNNHFPVKQMTEKNVKSVSDECNRFKNSHAMESNNKSLSDITCKANDTCDDRYQMLNEKGILETSSVKKVCTTSSISNKAVDNQANDSSSVSVERPHVSSESDPSFSSKSTAMAGSIPEKSVVHNLNCEIDHISQNCYKKSSNICSNVASFKKYEDIRKSQSIDKDFVTERKDICNNLDALAKNNENDIILDRPVNCYTEGNAGNLSLLQTNDSLRKASSGVIDHMEKDADSISRSQCIHEILNNNKEFDCSSDSRAFTKSRRIIGRKCRENLRPNIETKLSSENIADQYLDNNARKLDKLDNVCTIPEKTPMVNILKYKTRSSVKAKNSWISVEWNSSKTRSRSDPNEKPNVESQEQRNHSKNQVIPHDERSLKMKSKQVIESKIEDDATNDSSANNSPKSRAKTSRCYNKSVNILAVAKVNNFQEILSNNPQTCEGLTDIPIESNSKITLRLNQENSESISPVHKENNLEKNSIQCQNLKDSMEGNVEIPSSPKLKFKRKRYQSISNTVLDICEVTSSQTNKSAAILNNDGLLYKQNGTEQSMSCLEEGKNSKVTAITDNSEITSILNVNEKSLPISKSGDSSIWKRNICDFSNENNLLVDSEINCGGSHLLRKRNTRRNANKAVLQYDVMKKESSVDNHTRTEESKEDISDKGRLVNKSVKIGKKVSKIVELRKNISKEEFSYRNCKQRNVRATRNCRLPLISGDVGKKIEATSVVCKENNSKSKPDYQHDNPRDIVNRNEENNSVHQSENTFSAIGHTVSTNEENKCRNKSKNCLSNLEKNIDTTSENHLCQDEKIKTATNSISNICKQKRPKHLNNISENVEVMRNNLSITELKVKTKRNEKDISNDTGKEGNLGQKLNTHPIEKEKSQNSSNSYLKSKVKDERKLDICETEEIHDVMARNNFREVTERGQVKKKECMAQLSKENGSEISSKSKLYSSTKQKNYTTEENSAYSIDDTSRRDFRIMTRRQRTKSLNLSEIEYNHMLEVNNFETKSQENVADTSEETLEKTFKIMTRRQRTKSLNLSGNEFNDITFGDCNSKRTLKSCSSTKQDNAVTPVETLPKDLKPVSRRQRTKSLNLSEKDDSHILEQNTSINTLKPPTTSQKNADEAFGETRGNNVQVMTRRQRAKSLNLSECDLGEKLRDGNYKEVSKESSSTKQGPGTSKKILCEGLRVKTRRQSTMSLNFPNHELKQNPRKDNILTETNTRNHPAVKSQNELENKTKNEPPKAVDVDDKSNYLVELSSSHENKMNETTVKHYKCIREEIGPSGIRRKKAKKALTNKQFMFQKSGFGLQSSDFILENKFAFSKYVTRHSLKLSNLSDSYPLKQESLMNLNKKVDHPIVKLPKTLLNRNKCHVKKKSKRNNILYFQQNKNKKSSSNLSCDKFSSNILKTSVQTGRKKGREDKNEKTATEKYSNFKKTAVNLSESISTTTNVSLGNYQGKSDTSFQCSKINEGEDLNVGSKSVHQITSIPCVDGANDSDSDDFHHVLPAIDKERKVKKKRYIKLDAVITKPAQVIPVNEARAENSYKTTRTFEHNSSESYAHEKMTFGNKRKRKWDDIHNYGETMLCCKTSSSKNRDDLTRYISSSSKTLVCDSDIKRFQPCLLVKKLKLSYPKETGKFFSIKRQRSIWQRDKSCFCADNLQTEAGPKFERNQELNKGVLLDQHSERLQKTDRCKQHGGDFAKVKCQHSGAEYEEQTLCEQNTHLIVSSDQVLSSDLTNSRLKSDQDTHHCKSSRERALFSSSDRECVLDESCHENTTIHSILKPFSPENFTSIDSVTSDNFEVRDKLQNSLKSHDYNVQEVSSSQHSSPGHVKFCTIKNENGLQILSLKKSPPNRKQVRSSLKILNLPYEQFLEPFFSDPSDVMEKKEVGFKDLKINSHNVHELETFESSIGVTGLEMYRYDAISNLWDVSQISHDDPKNSFKSRSMKCALASHRETIITLNVSPPCVAKVKSWAKAREDYKKSIKVTNLEYKLDDLACSVECKTCDSSDIALLNDHKIVESENNSETTPSAIDKYDPINFYESKLENKSLSISSSHQESTTSIFSKEDSPLFCLSEMKNLHEVHNQQYCSTEQMSEKDQVHEQFTTPGKGNDSVSRDSLGYKLSYQNLQDCRAVLEPQYLTILTVEIHVQTRGDLLPDPAHDSVCAVFYSIQNDVANDSFIPTSHTGMIIVQRLTFCRNNDLIHSIASGSEVKYVPDERALMEEVINLVRQWDPDILAGYEVEMLSWGYLFERAFALELNLCSLVSRIPGARQRGKTKQLFDESESESLEDLSLLGRIVLNVWRLMRHEVALQSYTFENIAFHVLHERVPLHSFKTLTQWWGHRTSIYWGRVVDHYLLRVLGLLRIINQLDLINRTSELARIFGIQFYEVLSRGSQFRVESMMLRLAKPMNYIPVSPSIQQRARMRAPEYLQLIMEPESKLYVDPVIVLDFQSLYPSMIIAYNYCFSTCLGRVEHLGQSSPFEFGSSHLKIPPDEVKSYLGNINISPCGVAFVKANIRKGILPRMLEEILETRLMVKATMKQHKNDKALQRILHSRQLGLKLIANVTYGYTAANFSGRMACVEVADSVVSKGRETLERAIHLVENTPRWGARVVYGDTDSMFVLVPGRSRQDAFEIGAEIAEAVTFDNPTPVKLKLEKVYQPCLLQTKKRYVGYMYENAAQKDPVYDAKGIETVRRDGCPAVAKILEKSLRLLFETKDVSKVKSYVQNKFTKLLEGQMSLQDLIFAREYRGSNGYKPGACVPALELTKRWLMTDPRAEPRVSERVPYVIVSGAPNVPLIRLVRAPQELLMEPSLHIHAHYYISRVICPPLSRCFSLIGCDVLSWYTDLPRRIMLSLPKSISFNDQRKKITISQYFSTSNCLICYQICQTGICSDCQMQPQKTSVILSEKLHNLERNLFSLEKICNSCCGFQDTVKCISLDCSVMYQRLKAHHSISQEYFLRHHLENLSL